MPGLDPIWYLSILQKSLSQQLGLLAYQILFYLGHKPCFKTGAKKKLKNVSSLSPVPSLLSPLLLISPNSSPFVLITLTLLLLIIITMSPPTPFYVYIPHMSENVIFGFMSMLYLTQNDALHFHPFSSLTQFYSFL
jgi:hypothetical protein